MTDYIVPPPELVQQWAHEWNTLGVRHPDATNTASYVATRAAQWGADQELEACCEWIVDGKDHELSAAYSRTISANLRAARRPKPPSLKKQALEVFEALIHGDASGLDVGVIRRALEALPE
jgi:hypothetical protein